jgi:hypothetical protein
MTRRGSSYLLLSDFERLEEWCRNVFALFSEVPYLVGSATRTEKYRDVDVRLILADDHFDAAWGPHDGDDGLGDARLRLRLMNRAVSIWGQQETGLPIDFQIQRQTEANAQYPVRPGNVRNPMGLRDWTNIPTSGVPKGGHEAAADDPNDPLDDTGTLAEDPPDAESDIDARAREREG